MEKSKQESKLSIQFGQTESVKKVSQLNTSIYWMKTVKKLPYLVLQSIYRPLAATI